MFHKNYKSIKVQDDLLAGFLTAIDKFVQEVADGDLKSIVIKGSRFSYIIDEFLMIILRSDDTDNELLIYDLLAKILNRFKKKYAKYLQNFAGNLFPFKDFDKDIEEIILGSEIFIKCETCKRIIPSEYKIRQVGMRLLYFCCPLCEESFSYNKYSENHKRLLEESVHLRCQQCDLIRPMPIHCDKPMHLENIKGKDLLVCWMGLECNSIEIPMHCGKVMKIESKMLN